MGEPDARVIVKVTSSNRVPSFEEAKAKHDLITSQVPMARMIAVDPSFVAAYRDYVPELPGYGERRPFYQLLWCLEFAQNTQDHLDTTNALLMQLGLPSLNRFS